MSGGHLLLVECGQYVFTICFSRLFFFLHILYVKDHSYVDLNTVHFITTLSFHLPELTSQGGDALALTEL